MLRYANNRDWVEGNEGVERLFHYNCCLIATHFQQARAGTVGALFEHYLEWKDTSPVPVRQVATDLGVQQLSSQQLLVAGMLRPAHLIDILANFTLFTQSGGKTVKIVARYQQFRAVYAAIQRLREGQTRPQHGTADQRGGIIWHTQGSGKSLTMVFLVRKLRSLPGLQRFKVVVVTDRTDLEKQLSETAVLTNEPVRKARNVADLKAVLAEQGAALVFAMIQKYQQQDEDATIVEVGGQASAAVPERRVAESPAPYSGRKPARLALQEAIFPVLNTDPEILVLVDEAHRSQASTLHANLLQALPNCARIAFTGTPIMAGERKQTIEIFGDFIDRYTIQQSEVDGATLPIRYEGRAVQHRGGLKGGAGSAGGGSAFPLRREDKTGSRRSRPR